MTEQEWLVWPEPTSMLRWLDDKKSVLEHAVAIKELDLPLTYSREVPRLTPRQRTLFACAWWRMIQPHQPHQEEILQIIEASGKFIPATYPDGSSVPEGPFAAEIIDAAWLIRDCGYRGSPHASNGASILRDIVGNPYARVHRSLPCAQCHGSGYCEKDFPPGVAAMLPARGPCHICEGTGKVSIDWSYDRWRTRETLGIGRTCYESRDFSDLPIMADALEEAGCDNTIILEHCRQPISHVRGCWVVDLILRL